MGDIHSSFLDTTDHCNYMNSPLTGNCNLIMGGGKLYYNNFPLDIFNEMESTNHYSNLTNLTRQTREHHL